MNQYVLGVLSSRFMDKEENKIEYGQKILVSGDVVNFLNNHDVYKSEYGEKVFAVNRVHYVFLGQSQIKEPETEIVDEKREMKRKITKSN